MAEVEPDGVFDTNILIDQLNGVIVAADEIDRFTKPAISIVTWIEVLAGANSQREDAIIRHLLKDFALLPITDAIAERAAEIRRTTRLKLPDAVILATAEVHGCLLITRNTRDFSVSDPRVRVPYRL